jgi:2'-5' RNA ligase
MATFDTEGARKAGYSDIEIAHYLGRTGRSIEEMLEHLGKSRRMQNSVHEFSSTQINLPKGIADRMRALGRTISDKHLQAEKGSEDGGSSSSTGRENEPHITLKYGLHTEDPEEVRKLLEAEPPIRFRLGKVSRFSNAESGDVIKVEVDSPDLHRLNKKLSDHLAHTDSYPNYSPHATIAYVQAGKAKHLENVKRLAGMGAMVDTVVFSGKNGKRAEIKLKGRRNEKAARDK